MRNTQSLPVSAPSISSPLLLIMLISILLSACRFITGPERDPAPMNLEEIISAYAETGRLNAESRAGNLDESRINRYNILGTDIRNGKVLVRRCETRLFGCMMTYNVFGLFYTRCDSMECLDVAGQPVVDYEGYAGSPRFVGCAPDTSGERVID